MRTQLKISLKIFAFLTLILGIAYPLIITGIAQLAFPDKANGSLIRIGNRFVGSKLIGQRFDNNNYFLSRPSAVSYDPLPSGGSNYGMTNVRLKNLVTDRQLQFRTFNNLDDKTEIPSEMVFASGSGVDPHISPKAAYLQVKRIVISRQFDEVKKQRLLQIISELTEPPQYKFLGEERINVLMLNLRLDQIK